MNIHLPGPLTLDIGPVGLKEPREPYEVVLHLTRLKTLLAHALQAHRVAELLRLARPGDLLTYIDVGPKHLPRALQQRLVRQFSLGSKAPAANGDITRVPIPWERFDAVHRRPQDDSDPEDAAWERAKQSVSLHRFLSAALLEVLRVQRSLNVADPLIGHIVRQCLARQHSDDFVPLWRLTQEVHRCEPGSAAHSIGFYEQLAQVLRDPAIGSVAYRGQGDYAVQRLLATEQRRRGGNADGPSLDAALAIHALVNHPVRAKGWEARMHFYDEGLGPSDLFIDTDSVGGAPLAWLMDRGFRARPLVVFSSNQQIGLSGYEETSGPGWFCYRTGCSTTGQPP